MLLRERGLDLVIRDDAAFVEIDKQHLARLQTPLVHDALFGHRQHTDFGGHDDMVVVGHHISRRAQAVAVEGGADLTAIGKGDRGGAIPGLHQRGVIFVEGAQLGIHEIVAGPGLRDQQHHGVGQGIAARHQQLERIVDTGRIALPMGDQRPHLVEIRAHQVRGHGLAPRGHPVDVAAHSVDLAVMGQHAVGMGQRP